RAGGAAGRAAGGQQGLVDGLPAERRPEGAMALPARGMGLESVEELEATSPAQRPGAAARVRAAARALPVGDPGPLPLAAGNQSGRRHQQQDQGHQAGGLRLPGRRLLLPEDPGGLPRTWVKNLFHALDFMPLSASDARFRRARPAPAPRAAGQSTSCSRSSFGRAKTMLSGSPSSSRTAPAPSSRRRASTPWTSTSGAEAPAVTPMWRRPATHSGSISAAPSIR